jgi:hypothetical protein
MDFEMDFTVFVSLAFLFEGRDVADGIPISTGDRYFCGSHPCDFTTFRYSFLCTRKKIYEIWHKHSFLEEL